MIIYLITNRINNKKYVGQTVQTLKNRWARHCWNSTTKRSAMAISHAIKLYKKENFEIIKLQSCNDLLELNQAEQYWISNFNTLAPNGYNLCSGGRGNGYLSEETKLKISKSNKGKIVSLETRKKLSDSHKGYVVTDETKEKLRNHFKGIKQKPDHVVKRCNAMRKIVCKTYTFINPNGELITFINMKQFCKDNQLSNPHMNQVSKGKRLSHKGWKLPLKDSNECHQPNSPTTNSLP